MRYINYHKHSDYSNIWVTDTICKPEHYIKRAIELGHKEYFSTEHGYQGNIYETQTLCEKYGLKPIYGVEAYYVDDMDDKFSRESSHIILIAMTKKGQKQITKIMSLSNTRGFYYKPKIDLRCLLSLNPKDVVITTACIAGRMFKENWEEDFFLPLAEHFGNNFFLEVQSHIDLVQAEYNKNILYVHKKYGTKLIHANDSHYIYPDDYKYRDLFLKGKGISYKNKDESNFILDYPDSDEIFKRYKKQGVLSEEEVKSALENTLIFDNAEPISTNKNFKIPNIPLDVLKNEINNCEIDINDSDEVLKEIIKKAWKEEKKNIKKENILDYEKAIYHEINIIKNCGMAKYFILDHIIVKRAVEKYNAVLTKSGRGSAVSFYINKLLGLTEVDRIKSPITLYPTRFMSAERILSSRSLPDIDLNFANVEPVIQASKDILGDDGIYYMIAYKSLKESSAFRLWCKANDYNIKEYNDVAKKLDNYIEDEKWASVIEDSKIFRGVIESISPSPCSFLLSDKPISEEVGLIKVGNVICCALDGYNCDVYKYLKNDYLTVKVYEIIDKVYKLIKKPIDNISSLVNKCDSKVWEIYEKGLTTTINQADSNFAKQTLKRYKPKNLAELSAWVASIRPGFSSLLNNFLDRQPYSTGVKELDNILEDSFHYLMYQESIMKYLVWLNLEEKNTYDIIKKISKKKFKEEELQDLKKRLLCGWIEKVGTEKGFDETWQVVMDAAHYSFNASHSLSVAIDSLYGAYLKANYPLEYFTVALSMYSDDTERTANLISEMPYFGIKLENIKFGKSKSDYSMDKINNIIYKGIASIKHCNTKIADELLILSKNNYKSFIELLYDIKNKKSLNSKQLLILTGLNFFSEFGKNKYLINVIDIFNKFMSCSQIKKSNLEKLGLSEILIKKYSCKETKLLYKDIDNTGLICEMAKCLENKSMNVIEQIKFEKEYLDYITYKNTKVNDKYYIVIDFIQGKYKTKPKLKLRNIKTGEEIKSRIKEGKLFKEYPFGLYSVLKINEFVKDFKRIPVNGKWIVTDEIEDILTDYEIIK